MSDTHVIVRPTRTEKDEALTLWSRRVRRIGGFVQLGWAGLWLCLVSLELSNIVGISLGVWFGVMTVGAIAYGTVTTAGRALRPTSSEARRLGRDLGIATLVQISASVVAPVFVIATDRADWALPAMVLTVGPLLLWLDHRVHIPRYRPVGWALVLGPVVAAATLSGPSLTFLTGTVAGLLLLGTALAGFHDLTGGGADTTDQRSWRTGDPAGSTGLGAAFGAAVGLTVGLIARGPDGIPLSSAIGAGLGVAFGSAIDASRQRRTATAGMLSDD